MPMTTIKPLQGWNNFPFETQRRFIHDKQSRLKGLGCTGNYSLTYFKGVPSVDSDREGQVFFIGHFNHARDTNKIDLGGKRESANYRRSCDDEDIDIGGPQMGGNGQGPTNMPQAISVVGIHKDVIGGLAGHATSN